ncbi:MAG TPA: hypothetical protein VF720_12705 [Candidatus Eisenbacteria bacterium]
MDDLLTRLAENMHIRATGPMKFRLILQPLMASIFAIMAGLKDARAGRSPFFWGLINDPANRADMLKDGWKSVGKVFVIALVLETVFQVIVLKTVYPLEALSMALLLAIVPYLLLRGLTSRLASRR